MRLFELKSKIYTDIYELSIFKLFYFLTSTNQTISTSYTKFEIIKISIVFTTFYITFSHNILEKPVF